MTHRTDTAPAEFAEMDPRARVARLAVFGEALIRFIAAAPVR